MSRSIRFVAIAFMSLAALALCASAWAQPGPGVGPRPGFGMFVSGPGASLSMMYGPLLNVPTVQKDLDLLDEQKAEIKPAIEKAQAAMRELFSGMRDLSPEERRVKMEEIGKKMQVQAEEMKKTIASPAVLASAIMQAQAEELKKTIEHTLLPNQLKRLKGIALQIADVRALTDKEVQQDLKLSDEQTAKIKSIGEDSMKKISALFSEGGDRQTVGPKIQELRKDSEKQIMDVLTDDQKASLEKMKGDKLEIPPAEFGGFGGRRGSGPGGAGGGG